jgi:hypothetical protein
MNIKQRKQLLSILDNPKLHKTAQQIVEDVNSANIEDPQEFAHKIFQKLLENLEIVGLDSELD